MVIIVIIVIIAVVVAWVMLAVGVMASFQHS
jgi:hypothetical protein